MFNFWKKKNTTSNPPIDENKIPEMKEKWEVTLIQTSTGVIFEKDKETILPNGDIVNVIDIFQCSNGYGEINYYSADCLGANQEKIEIIIKNPAFAKNDCYMVETKK